MTRLKEKTGKYGLPPLYALAVEDSDSLTPCERKIGRYSQRGFLVEYAEGSGMPSRFVVNRDVCRGEKPKPLGRRGLYYTDDSMDALREADSIIVQSKKHQIILWAGFGMACVIA